MNHNPVVPNAPPTMSCVTEDCRRDIPVYCDGEGRVLIQRYSASSPDCDTADKYTWTSELEQDDGCGYMVEPIVRMLAADATAITLEMSIEHDGYTDYTGWPTVLGTGWIRTNHTDALEALQNGSHWQTREIAGSWEQSEPDKYCFVSVDGAELKTTIIYGPTVEDGYVTRWPDMMSAFDGLCFHWVGHPGGQFYGEVGQTERTDKYTDLLVEYVHSPMHSHPDRMGGLQVSTTWLTMKPGFCCLPKENVKTFKNVHCEIETCQTNTSLNEAGDECCADRPSALTYGDDCVVASCVDGYVLMSVVGGDVCVATTFEPTTEPTSEPTTEPTSEPTTSEPRLTPTRQPTEPLHPTPPRTPRPEAEAPNTEVSIIAQPRATPSVNWMPIGVTGLGALAAFIAAIGVAWYRASKDRAKSAQRVNRRRQKIEERTNTTPESLPDPSLDSPDTPVSLRSLAVSFTAQVHLTTQTTTGQPGHDNTLVTDCPNMLTDSLSL